MKQSPPNLMEKAALVQHLSSKTSPGDTYLVEIINENMFPNPKLGSYNFSI